MGGRVIYEELAASRRFNKLWELHDMELSVIVYVMTLIQADMWGHIPFDLRWVNYKAIPGYRGPHQRLLRAMVSLLVVELWEGMYEVNGEKYVHIFNFEEKSAEGIRHRRKGRWPDECGTIPTRRKDEKIGDSLIAASKIRKDSNLHVSWREIYKNDIATITENPETFRDFPKDRIGLDRIGQDIKRTGIPDFEATSSPVAEIASGGLIVKKTTPLIVRNTYLKKLAREENLTPFEVALLVFRARNARDPHAWIQSARKKDFINNCSQEEYDDPGYVDRWIGSYIDAVTTHCSEISSIEDVVKITNDLVARMAMG